jgi:hypothetical protein
LPARSGAIGVLPLLNGCHDSRQAALEEVERLNDN